MTSPDETANTPALLPVSMSAEGLRVAAKITSKMPEIPEDGSKLPILQQESYQMQASVAAKLGFPIASLSTDDKLTVMLFARHPLRGRRG